MDYHVSVNAAELTGFWELTTESREVLKKHIGRMPGSGAGSSIHPSPEEVDHRSFLLAFTEQPTFADSGKEDWGAPLRLGIMEKFPFGNGQNLDTRLMFEWKLNDPKGLPWSMFSPQDLPIPDAGNWVDICYEGAPSMRAYRRYYLGRRGGSLRMIRRSEDYQLEWRSISEGRGAK